MSAGSASAVAPSQPRRRRAPWFDPYLRTVAEKVLAFQVSCQLLLLFPFLGPLRVPIRSASYGVSLVLLGLLGGASRRMHPAAWPALGVLTVLLLSLAHPDGNTVLASCAQVAMYTAVLAPLFWIPRREHDVAALRRLLLLLWAFHFLSSIVGVLQVHFPGQFQLGTSSNYTARKLHELSITLSSGARILRPTGLSDVAGGAAWSGFYAVLLGLGLFSSESRRPLRWTALASIAVGLFCLYLSQVRSMLVLAGICTAAYAGFLAWRGHLGRLGLALLSVGALSLVTFGWAVEMGGASVTDRLGTLVAEDPGEVYYRNRGSFLQHTVEEVLPQYPLGAGLGRWGMVNNYFGDNSDPERGEIWVEIQWTGWVLDGGIPLVLGYLLAIAAALWVAWRIAQRGGARSRLWLYAALVLSYDLGALAMTFNSTVFHSQMGIEIWLLNATLFAAYLAERRQRRAQRLARGAP